ncbi:PH domain-containing protein [Gillisia sp. CAL575]|uniref:PH domain-containing protein n=1 Tax=Gillisia sp. CAL575 TaxID=985255 RepID=UPI0006850418|nr:PH domain-containing protein [Gillisia sp. CAL575]
MENFTNNSIDIDTLPKYEEVSFQSISKAYLIKASILNLVFLCLAVIGWVVLFYFELNQLQLNLFLVGVVLYFGFKFWNIIQLQKNYGFALREKDILYRRGYLVNKTTVVPFNRIQHVSITRDVLDKMFKISSLKIYTAGGSGGDIIIPGLAPNLAQRLKEALAAKLTTNEV